jgi:hypothetical protein
MNVNKSIKITFIVRILLCVSAVSITVSHQSVVVTDLNP